MDVELHSLHEKLNESINNQKLNNISKDFIITGRLPTVDEKELFSHLNVKSARVMENNSMSLKYDGDYLFELWLEIYYTQLWISKKNLFGLSFLNTFITKLLKRKKHLSKIKLNFLLEYIKFRQFLLYWNNMSTTYPILYKIAKNGSVNVWVIKIEHNDDESMTVIMKYGKLEGKQTDRRYIITHGKSNRTTLEQAKSEAKSKYQFKLKSGYAPSIKNAKKEQQKPRPMLAKKWTAVVTKPEFPLYVQPKLDGIRGLAHFENSKTILTMRSGDVVTSVPHINNDLNAVYESLGEKAKTYYFDGEFYSHGSNLQSINMIVRGSKLISDSKILNTNDVKFYIYDMFDTRNMKLTNQQRNKILDDHVPITNNIKLVKTRSVSSATELRPMHDKFVKKGFEGLIIRSPIGLYEFGVRSNSLFKLKVITTDEGKIIDIVRSEKDPKKIIITCLDSKSGQKFRVSGSGTDEYRNYVFENKDKYIGNFIRYSYNERTMSGKPKFARPVMRTVENSTMSKRYTIIPK